MRTSKLYTGDVDVRARCDESTLEVSTCPRGLRRDSQHRPIREAVTSSRPQVRFRATCQRLGKQERSLKDETGASRATTASGQRDVGAPVTCVAPVTDLQQPTARVLHE